MCVFMRVCVYACACMCKNLKDNCRLRESLDDFADDVDVVGAVRHKEHANDHRRASILKDGRDGKGKME